MATKKMNPKLYKYILRLREDLKEFDCIRILTGEENNKEFNAHYQLDEPHTCGIVIVTDKGYELGFDGCYILEWRAGITATWGPYPDKPVKGYLNVLNKLKETYT